MSQPDFKHVGIMNVKNSAAFLIGTFDGLKIGEITPNPTRDGICFHRHMGVASVNDELAFLKEVHKQFGLAAFVSIGSYYRPDSDALSLADGLKTLDGNIKTLHFTSQRLGFSSVCGSSSEDRAKFADINNCDFEIYGTALTIHPRNGDASSSFAVQCHPSFDIIANIPLQKQRGFLKSALAIDPAYTNKELDVHAIKLSMAETHPALADPESYCTSLDLG